MLAATGVSLIPTLWLRWRCHSRLFHSPKEIDKRPVAIVPGAHVETSGEPSLTLADRLTAAAELFSREKVERILVSGGVAANGLDETRAMVRWLLRQGISRERIDTDDKGHRTRSTMVNAYNAFGITSAIICSQGFHLPRCLFLAQSVGIDALGMIADQRRYQHQRYNAAREQLAIMRAIWDVASERCK